jgi:hypothetical protein
MKILVWGIESDLKTAETKAEYLLNTAKYFGVDVELIGIGHTFTNFTNRLYILQDYLKDINPEEVILVMDGYDTLFNNTVEYTLSQFHQKNTKILISSEKLFTYQWGKFQHKFDTINSDYKYVNAGTFMGYAGDLKVMVDELFEIYKLYPTDIDQGLLGVWVYNNFEDNKKVQLDTNCDVFWVTSKDWDVLKNIDIEENISNPLTNSKPFVIHNTGNGDPNLYESYKNAYNKIISNYE